MREAGGSGASDDIGCCGDESCEAVSLTVETIL